MPHHDGGTQSLYIIRALLWIFREATGKQRLRETFASAAAEPAFAKVLELSRFSYALFAIPAHLKAGGRSIGL